MPQTITITVGEKIASTDFKEVVSFNSDYLLHFVFDGEWQEFTHRVAVAIWADGCAETQFEGEECELPFIPSSFADYVLIGVYAVNAERKIASTFVRLKCRAGAHSVPAEKNTPTLHEQILSFLNEKDWSIFQDKVASGVYSAVQVNAQGIVTEGKQILEVGDPGQQTPVSDLIAGGLFVRRADGNAAEVFYFDGSECVPLMIASATHAETATKASQDGNGNVISDTYATKTELAQEISEENALWKAETKEISVRIDDIEKGEIKAGYALYADRAASANSATSASSATKATNADHATNADEAVHAATADTATTATNADHAATADTATTAANADRAVSADVAVKATQDGNGNVISDTYATKTELSQEISEENALWKVETKENSVRIDDIEKGEIKAGYALYADRAASATSATSASSATKAAQDGNGNVISDTYATKASLQSEENLRAASDAELEGRIAALETSSGGSSGGSSGSMRTLSGNINGTSFSYNGASELSLPAFYAPSSGGTSGYFLRSNGSSSAPSWVRAPMQGVSGSRPVASSRITIQHGLGAYPSAIFLQLNEPDNKVVNYYVVSYTQSKFDVVFFAAPTGGEISVTGVLCWIAVP